MRKTAKAQLKIHAVESGQLFGVGAVLVGAFVVLDAYFDHSREPLTFATVLVVSFGLSCLVGTFLGVLLADLRQRLLVAAVEDEQDA
ncbi:hypothetical protein [Streptomyces sp. NPDC058268]|uniref:hypothetical protein n=1 Tax=Streptomyces sp. NPDC058268 TaxID=3346413 RepID=UPI0036F13C3B